MSQAIARRTLLNAVRAAPRRFKAADLHTWAPAGDVATVQAAAALRHLRIEPSPLGGIAGPLNMIIRPPPGLSLDDTAPGAGIVLSQLIESLEPEDGGCLATAAAPRTASLSKCSTASDSTEARSPKAAQGKGHDKLGDSSYSPGRVFLEAAYARPAAAPILLSDALPASQESVPPPPPPPPSIGSAGHHLGLCRPCDFTYRNGSCREGAACRFCHLCGPEVGKRRKKQRRNFLSAVRQNQRPEAATSST